MTYSLIIKEEAVTDIEEAFIYYEKQVPDLGVRFIQELEEHFEKLKDHPLHYSFFLNQQVFRSLSLKNFPFLIIYEAIEDSIIVWAAHNHYQNSDQIFKRK